MSEPAPALATLGVVNQCVVVTAAPGGGQGAEFAGKERIEGRRQPDATKKAAPTRKENADYLSEAERLVACFERIVEEDLDRVPRLAEAELREALATVRHRPRAITNWDIAKVCAAWRMMQAHWNDLAVGESICIEWPPFSSPGEDRQR